MPYRSETEGTVRERITSCLQPGPLGQGYQGQQYYQQVPPYQQPYPYSQRQSSGGGVPWAWMIFGGILALVLSKASFSISWTQLYDSSASTGTSLFTDYRGLPSADHQTFR